MHIRSLSLRSALKTQSTALRILSRNYAQLMRQALIPRTALLLTLSIWGASTQAQTTVPTGSTPYFYMEQGNKVELIASSKFMVNVVDASEYSDQVSRNQLNKINNRINQQAEAAQLNYIREVGDPKKQIFLWEKSTNTKKISGLFSKVYQRININDDIIAVNSDYLIPTGGILVEAENNDSSSLMTWIREHGRDIQQITNDALYWVTTELGEDSVSIATEISHIKGIKTAKPSFKTIKLP
jgi:hypothetical protein